MVDEDRRRFSSGETKSEERTLRFVSLVCLQTV